VPSSLAAQTGRELRNTDSNRARRESLPITLGYKRFAHAADVAIPDTWLGYALSMGGAVAGRPEPLTRRRRVEGSGRGAEGFHRLRM
jgi:hypothetical protein